MKKPEEKRPWPKLPADFREKWTKALRSGEYRQSKGALYRLDDDGFCCLGLAAHLCGSEKEEMDRLLTLGDRNSFCFPKIPEGLPTELVGTARENSLVQQLAGMNDGIGMPRRSFPEIADWIDENLS